MDFLEQLDDDPENIWVAASNGDIANLSRIMQAKGFTVNVQDETGYTPM